MMCRLWPVEAGGQEHTIMLTVACASYQSNCITRVMPESHVPLSPLKNEVGDRWVQKRSFDTWSFKVLRDSILVITNVVYKSHNSMLAEIGAFPQ